MHSKARHVVVYTKIAPTVGISNIASPFHFSVRVAISMKLKIGLKAFLRIIFCAMCVCVLPVGKFSMNLVRCSVLSVECSLRYLRIEKRVPFQESYHSIKSCQHTVEYYHHGIIIISFVFLSIYK